MAYHRYEIAMGVCDECRFAANTRAREELEAKYPDLWDTPNRSVKPEYMDEWRAIDDEGEVRQPIFVFVADCGGDAIYLCLKHLLEAVDALAQFKEA
jgi:hypothetical protein